MSEDPRTAERSPLRRVSVIVRSWDGPNSRIGLEMDLTQMPWGPFDALGKRLNLLVPAPPGGEAFRPASESRIERALRHVEHAADRCGEFARLANGNQELWLRSQETWEWVRKYLTAHWVDVEVDARPKGAPDEASEGEPPRPRALPVDFGAEPAPPDAPGPGPAVAPLPSLPGAASTLQAVARALRATPLSVWRESMGASDEDAPTREEAIQTLLAVARILGAGEGGEREAPTPTPPEPQQEPSAQPAEDPDPDQVSFDFASGYDEGYRMGRRVGLALGAQKGARQGKR